MSQIAGVRTFQYQYGRADGVNAAGVHTGSGLNFGYPVVSEHTRSYSSAEKVEPWNEDAKKGDGVWDRFERPQADYAYQCFLHQMPKEKKKVFACLVNEQLDFGGYVEYSPQEMPCFNEWKMMGRQDYVVGLEPGINIPEGRVKARELGNLTILKPGESRDFHYTIGVLPDREAIKEFLR